VNSVPMGLNHGFLSTRSVIYGFFIYCTAQLLNNRNEFNVSSGSTQLTIGDPTVATSAPVCRIERFKLAPPVVTPPPVQRYRHH
jgi:hypothetical protein